MGKIQLVIGSFGPDSIFELSSNLLTNVTIWTGVVVVAEIFAILSIMNVVMRARTAAGTWGWALALFSFPFVAVPMYWIFGRRKFRGYLEQMRNAREKHEDLMEKVFEMLRPHFIEQLDCESEDFAVLEKLSERRFSDDNEVELLINGAATFDSIFQAIEAAEKYVLVQFFIIKSDDLGKRFQDLLLRKAAAGVQILVLFDEIGSHKLGNEYVEKLKAGGVLVYPFHTRQGRSNRFQINFRNHRKIVVVDGDVAFVGGHNVGDEYLGKSDRFGNWRDTHVKVRGPSVMGIQFVFLSDWYWATRQIPELDWFPKFQAPENGMVVLPLPTGPIDDVEGATLFFLTAINNAKKRLWIASPYFVTDESIRAALNLAAMRGVDVRIMIPFTPDKYIPWLATFSYLGELEAAGVRVFRYTDGFLHQKAILVDDRLGSVGTANLDNRSMRLNFEISIIVLDPNFCADLEKMFLADFEECREVGASDYTDRPLWFRIGVRLARLGAPVL